MSLESLDPTSKKAEGKESPAQERDLSSALNVRLSNAGRSIASTLDREALQSSLSDVLAPHVDMHIEEVLCQAYERLARRLGHAPTKVEIQEAHNKSVALELSRDKNFIGPLIPFNPSVGQNYTWDTYRAYFGSIKELRERAGVPLDSRRKYSGQPVLADKNPLKAAKGEDTSTRHKAAAPPMPELGCERYFEGTDSFIWIACGEEGELVPRVNCFRSWELDKGEKGYKIAVVQAVIPDTKKIFDKLKISARDSEFYSTIDELYLLAVNVNPDLDIYSVSFKASAAKGASRSAEKGSNPFISLKAAANFTQLARQNLIGQERALDQVASRQRGVCILREPERPVASYLFLGASGVGKTELARLMARAYLDESALIRIDCSEFALPHEYAKLIGSPPGYIGHAEGGQLTDKIHKNPVSVVLFDEIEKAHAKVHHLLLQILDTGQLSDNRGRAHSFRDAVVILTSNVGLRDIEALRNRCGFNPEEGDHFSSEQEQDIEQSFFAAARSTFNTELLGRIDEIVAFRYLNRQDALKIAKLKLDECCDIARGQGHTISIRSSFAAWLIEQEVGADSGAKIPLFSREAGARHIKKFARDTVTNLVLETIANQRLRADEQSYRFDLSIKNRQPVVRVAREFSADEIEI